MISGHPRVQVELEAQTQEIKGPKVVNSIWWHLPQVSVKGSIVNCEGNYFVRTNVTKVWVARELKWRLRQVVDRQICCVYVGDKTRVRNYSVVYWSVWVVTHVKVGGLLTTILPQYSKFLPSRRQFDCKFILKIPSVAAVTRDGCGRTQVVSRWLPCGR